MKITLYKKDEKFLEKEINEDLSIRISTTDHSIIFKIRNEAFEKIGRAFALDSVNEVDKITIGTETYENLKYKNHDFYIHKITDEARNVVVEDLNITFKKEV